MALPLSGVSLVECGSDTAPPGLVAAIGLCGRIAADLGADVVRLCTTGDQATPQPFLHAGKRSMRAHGPHAQELHASLVTGADILLSDPRRPDAPRPRRVHVSLSMDGSDTPDAQDSEFTIEARSGMLDIVGDPARSPLRLAGHQTAYAAGLAAFTAMVAALCQPALPHGPRHVRVRVLETAIWLNWKSLAVAARTGRAPRRAGSNGEWPVLPCADGHVAVVHRVQEWGRLREMIADPEIRAERFQTVAGRRAHRADLNAILARHFAPLTRADIHDLAMRHKMPFGAVWTPDELRADPQMQARGMFRPLDVDGVEYRLPRLPVVWNEAAPQGAAHDASMGVA